MAGGRRRYYSPNQLIVLVNGVRIEGGADDFVSFKPSADKYTMTVDLSGDVTATFNTDASGELTLKVKGNSLGAKALAAVDALFSASELAGTGLPPLVIQVVDATTGTMIRESEAFPKASPEIAYGKERGDLTWTYILPGARDRTTIAPLVT